MRILLNLLRGVIIQPLFYSLTFVFFCSRVFSEKSDRFVLDDARTYQLLEHFLRDGINRGDFGYILEGAKPLSTSQCIPLSYLPCAKSFEYSEERFTETLLIEELLPVLENMNQHSSQFTFKCTQVRQDGHTELEFLFINRPKLRRTIHENINLFRFALTPSCETNELVDQILHAPRPLEDLLKKQDALFGIVFGYLPQNSLLGGRTFSLITQSISQEHPPFERQSRLLKPCSTFSPTVVSDIQGLFYLGQAGGGSTIFRRPGPRMKPSHPFKTVNAELDYIQSKSEKLPSCLREAPRFIFGPYRTEDTSNQPFFELLKRVQNQTRLMGKNEFLVELVLEKILGYRPKVTCRPLQPIQPLESLIKLDKQRWISILTDVMENLECHQDKLAFIESFHSPRESYKVAPKIMGATPKRLKGLELAKANLEKSNSFFEEITENYQAVIPKRLYHRLMRSGEGKQINGCDEVRVHFTLKDINGNTLSASYNSWFNLSEVFQGFRLGVQGMHEGEKRKILIHPALGYGPFTTLPPCASLVLTVELLEVINKKEQPNLPPDPIDFSLIENHSFYEDLKSSIDQLPLYRGAFYAEMFQKFGGIDKGSVVSELKKRFGS